MCCAQVVQHNYNGNRFEKKKEEELVQKRPGPGGRAPAVPEAQRAQPRAAGGSGTVHVPGTSCPQSSGRTAAAV